MNKTVLIVEDDVFVSELYDHQFKKAGFITQVATDGETALDIVKDTDFDLILLDIMIPKKDGLEVLKELKKNNKTKDIIVIILSNLGQDEMIKQALQIGAKAYIVKSLYTPAQVVAEVQSVLGV